MKSTLITLLVILGLCVIAVVTCPDRQAHKDAMMDVINKSIHHSLSPSDPEDAELSAFFGSLGSNIAGFFLDDRLSVKNYFVCSTGIFTDFDGESKPISFGVFGHVFTFDEQDLDVLWDKAWDDYWASNSLIPSFGQEDKSARTNILPDTIMGIEVPDEVDSLVNDVTDDAIRAAKEWAKQQFDEL